MSTFSIKNLTIFILTLFLLESSIAEEIIIPKSQPKIDKLRNNLNDKSNSQEQMNQIIKEIDLIQKNKNLLLEKYSNG